MAWRSCEQANAGALVLVNSCRLNSPQAKREEAISIVAQLKDGPGPDRGRRPEHRDGLRREAEGGTPLVRVWEAVLHQHAGARRAHELLTFDARPPHFICWTFCCIVT